MTHIAAKYIVDEDGACSGCCCCLPNGTEVEVTHQTAPVYALCCELDRLGYGDWHLSVTTPDGATSFSCIVKYAATITVIENDEYIQI